MQINESFSKIIKERRKQLPLTQEEEYFGSSGGLQSLHSCFHLRKIAHLVMWDLSKRKLHF